jgi:hypothetical protein
MSAVEWKDVIDPGPLVLRVESQCPTKSRIRQLMGHAPVKTTRHVNPLMLQAGVLMRNEEAKYHGGPNSCNSFRRNGAFAAAPAICAS